MTEDTGLVDFTVGNETFKTWYKVVGDLSSGKLPLVVLHGGPGITHIYLHPHAELCARFGIPIIFYDQIGCGQSTHLPDKPASFWTVDLFMDELANLLQKLSIQTYDLYGHSWGGMLAADFAASRHPSGLRRLIICGSAASKDLWEASLGELLERFPEDAQNVVRAHEAAGTTSDPAYQSIVQEFYKKHICLSDPWPQYLLDAFAAMTSDPSVYHHMWGTCEFSINGTLQTWSVVDRLSTIACPTLIINGAEDEAQDVGVAPFFELIPKAQWVVFGHSSHMAYFEEPEKYWKVLGCFLTAE